MTNLDCDVINCVYNKDASCVRKNIEVEGDSARFASETCCGSFEQRRSGCSTCNSTQEVCKDTDVTCEAVECRFNKSKKCSANHIGISGRHADNMRETECARFTI